MMRTVAGPEAGALEARARALAVLRIRSTALAVALLPAAAAVVLLAGSATGSIGGSQDEGWTALRWAVTGCALVVLLLAAAVAAVVVRARPALTPTVPVAEETAPDLYQLIRDLAERLEVPAPSAIALTPDCDSWLEDRTHPAHANRRERRDRGAVAVEEPRPVRGAGRPGPAAGADRVVDRPERGVPRAPVLVIGSPFLWWMRVAELRALLAPVVAGTGPSVHPDIASARRFVRGLDAAVAVAARGGEPPSGPAPALVAAVRRPAFGFVGWVARLLLRGCRDHAAEMERAVAAAASERAQTVDYGLRIVAQEQVGLAYAGWDRLLTRVALPAWRMGRWPSRLDAGVVSALTELSRRDRLAEGFTSRLSERPACDLLEEPGAMDEATSLLAARLFHGGPPEPGPDWSPVDWGAYPEEVVDRKWRQEAARLNRLLDERDDAHEPVGAAPAPARASGPAPATLARLIDRLTAAPAGPADSADSTDGGAPRLAARLSVEVAREEAAATRAHGQGPAAGAEGPAGGSGGDPWIDGFAPAFPLQPPRTGRELLADHVTAMVCCAAVDTAGAAPGLDWLDGPALLVGGRRRADLAHPVLSLVEDGDDGPLRAWLGEVGVRPEKPVRLV
ncbi:membrane protein [Streptomyces sp. PRh5]|nr:membrane protein [Streptomyces sp. PRh5]